MRDGPELAKVLEGIIRQSKMGKLEKKGDVAEVSKIGEGLNGLRGRGWTGMGRDDDWVI